MTLHTKHWHIKLVCCLSAQGNSHPANNPMPQNPRPQSPPQRNPPPQNPPPQNQPPQHIAMPRYWLVGPSCVCTFGWQQPHLLLVTYVRRLWPGRPRGVCFGTGVRSGQLRAISWDLGGHRLQCHIWLLRGYTTLSIWVYMLFHLGFAIIMLMEIA